MAKRGRPKKVEKIESLPSKINAYFKSEKGENKPTKAGLALALGYADKVSLKNAIDRNDEFSTPIKKAILRIEEKHESRMYDKNCTGSIFWLKNAGWTDVQEHNVRVEDIGKPLSIAEMKHRIKEAEKVGTGIDKKSIEGNGDNSDS